MISHLPVFVLEKKTIFGLFFPLGPKEFVWPILFGLKRTQGPESWPVMDMDGHVYDDHKKEKSPLVSLSLKMYSCLANVESLLFSIAAQEPLLPCPRFPVVRVAVDSYYDHRCHGNRSTDSTHDGRMTVFFCPCIGAA